LSFDKKIDNILGSILIIGQNQYEVKVNSPTVISIRLPKSIMSGFYVYPILSLEFCSFDECLYIWYKQRLPKEKSKKVKKVENSSECDGNESEKSGTEENEEVVGFGDWIKVCEGFHYCPQTDDIGSKLKVVCIPNNGFEMETISENSVELGLPPCPFEERHKYCSQESPIGSFRIVSYNILADVYADQEFTRTELFPYCPPSALKIDYRKQLLIKEIIGYNADIY
jgi:2',5'-phosphodiesterase